jgi:hypothetical protein
MVFDLQQDGWASDAARRRYRRIRASLISGLIKLAGAEPVPEGMTQDRSKESLTDEDRRLLLRDTLRDLENALRDFASLLEESPPTIPDDLGGVHNLREAVQEALRVVRDHSAWVARVEAIKGDSEKWASYQWELANLALLPKAVQPSLSVLINKWSPVRKIFVAVHGIGDQFQSETLQTVAYRVCDYVGVPTALPLGRFHGPGGAVTKAFVPDPDIDPPVNCGFAEIYWANVPRIPAADAHILEDPKKWAKTLVERLRLRASRPAAPGAAAPARGTEPTKEDDERLEELIAELIQGVVVADRLVFLADKAGLFKFDLKKLLNDYLNDVQVVTEFEDYRRQLLDIFQDVLEKVNRYFDRSEIYIVAHSEGTVVSFMGLLKGLSERQRWSRMVRGYMTIGSPLNKHVVFWPELFDKYKARDADPTTPGIPWKNYFDFGDPIGFNLQMTRNWMRERGWSGFFDFSDERNEDDIGFTRYYFPGAAHNDYWTDEDVFGNFIEEVVDRTNTVLPRGREVRHRTPRTRLLAFLTSYPMPYVLASALLFLACYIVYKAVRGALDPVGARIEAPPQIFLNVLGLWGIIAGMSLLARIPRLSRAWGWRLLALILAPLLASFYIWFVSYHNKYSVEKFLSPATSGDPYANPYNICLFAALVLGFALLSVEGLRPVLGTLLWVIVVVLGLRIVDGVLSGVLPLTGVLERPGLGAWLAAVPWRSLEVIVIALWIGFVAWRVSWRYPRIGTKPLVHTGGLIILMVVVTQFMVPSAPSEKDREITRQGLERNDRVTVARAVEDEARTAFRRIGGIIRERDAARAGGGPGTQPATKDQPAGSTPAGPGGVEPCCDPSTEEQRMVRDAAHMQTVTEAALDKGPIWPVFLAGAGFLYLWWLAIVLFDLTFVWHLYIRWSGAQKYINARLHHPGPERSRAG